jgi:hypothetical protein
MEINDVFKRNKSKWDLEIQQAFERLRKVEDDLHLKEKLLEAREKRLREMEIELISYGSKLAVYYIFMNLLFIFNQFINIKIYFRFFFEAL